MTYVSAFREVCTGRMNIRLWQNGHWTEIRHATLQSLRSARNETIHREVLGILDAEIKHRETYYVADPTLNEKKPLMNPLKFDTSSPLVNHCAQAAYNAMRGYYGEDPNDVKHPGMVVAAIVRDTERVLRGWTAMGLHHAWCERQPKPRPGKKRNPTLRPWNFLNYGDQRGFQLFVETVQKAKNSFQAGEVGKQAATLISKENEHVITTAFLQDRYPGMNMTKFYYCMAVGSAVQGTYVKALGQVNANEFRRPDVTVDARCHFFDIIAEILLVPWTRPQALHTIWYQAYQGILTYGPERTATTSPAFKPWHDLPRSERAKFAILHEVVIGAADHFDSIDAAGQAHNAKLKATTDRLEAEFKAVEVTLASELKAIYAAQEYVQKVISDGL